MPTDSSRSSPSRRSRRTHTSAFERIPCRADYRLNSFFPRTVRDWNTALPPETPGLSPLVHWRLHFSRGRYRGCSTVSMVLSAIICGHSVCNTCKSTDKLAAMPECCPAVQVEEDSSTECRESLGKGGKTICDFVRRDISLCSSNSTHSILPGHGSYFLV